ncbi:DoxX family protein [Sulfurimonas sp. MAG313]|nr:DoxX family protein [Sulfurimonas sp. MAG313]MDF1881306.1 DoxX family protein [Sulfurimonas sp. MAG313]
MCIKDLYDKGTKVLTNAEDVPLLFLRVILAYTFFGPAMLKINGIEAIAGYFEYLGIPFPTLNAYMAAGTEITGAVLLALGLFTRFISIPLLFVLLVAIATVHGANGFHVIMPGDAFAWENPYINGTEVPHTVVVLQNGYEMVMYYMAMLMMLVTKGGGRLSLDFLFFKKA